MINDFIIFGNVHLLSLFFSLLAVDFSDERRLSDHYSQGNSIGTGGFGSVYAGVCKRTGKSVSSRL